MEDNRILSFISYISVCFAPVIVPFIILLASSNQAVKQNAKSSLISQLIPLAYIPFIIFSIITTTTVSDQVPVLMIALFVLYGIASLVVFIWNIVKGIKVLAN